VRGEPHIVDSTIRQRRAESVKAAEEAFGLPWNELRARGDFVVKVNIEVIAEPEKRAPT
jgi:hypothetical protein